MIDPFVALAWFGLAGSGALAAVLIADARRQREDDRRFSRRVDLYLATTGQPRSATILEFPHGPHASGFTHEGTRDHAR